MPDAPPPRPLRDDGLDDRMGNVSTIQERPEPEAEERNEEFEESVLTAIVDTEPTSYRQAERSPDWLEWRKAMDEELESLKENEVWDVVPRPANRKIVDSKWVYKIKTDANGNIDRYKARLVARGFTQQPGVDYDEIFSPVVRFDSMRLLLAIAAVKGWRPRQLDVKTAFLYGILKEEVYMQLPEGSRQTGMVAKLKRCLYGLKQSSREWYLRLVNFLSPYGFVCSAFDPCVLVHDSGTLFIAIYVDDITLFGKSSDLLDKTVTILQTEFKVTDMGLLHWLLGIRIEINDEGISLSQSAFIDKILARFGMESCNPVSTPMDHNIRLLRSTDDDERVSSTSYQQIVGSINYLATATRPDLSYSITHLSQFNSDPSTLHMSALKRLLRYLHGTREQRLLYPWRSSLKLTGFCDASYGNILDSRRSFSGYLFQLGDSTVCWRARKQNSVAASTTEAEYMALLLATKQFIWLDRGLKEFLKEQIPSAVFTDNMSAIDIAHNPKLNDRTKHIDIAYHFTREQVEEGNLLLMHVASKDNLADICTKALPRPIHVQLCTKIFGTN